MRALRKTRLLSSVAGAALVFGFAGPASAFENLEWTWNKDVNETVDIDIDINADIESTGIVQLEKFQVQIGDVDAYSEVHDIDNNPIRDGNGTPGGTLEESFSFNIPYDDNAQNNPLTDVPVSQDEGGIEVTVTGGSVNNNDPNSVLFDLMVTAEIPADPGGESLDAEIELPTVESVATAVGNNQQITSEVGVYLHDGQYLFDQAELGDDNGSIPPRIPITVADTDNGTDDGADGNPFHLAGALLAFLGGAGIVEKANITATSIVHDILNARVDSSATAVGNNIGVEVNAVTAGDAVVMGDITQVSVADVSAYSDVWAVSVNGYENLNAVGPLVSSTATAVGNNVTVTVTSPGVDTGGAQ